MAGRNIRFDPACEAAADNLGGYRALDECLDAYWDALDRNPRGFPVI
jgi:hypothetical protein